MDPTPEQFMDTIRKWQEDWEQGHGPCPMVVPITFEPDILPLREAKLNNAPRSWEIELTYGQSRDGRPFFLSISGMDSHWPIHKITANEIYFEADGEPGRVFLSKPRRRRP